MLSKVFYIFVCGIGVFITFYPTLISNFALVQTDPGDTRLNNYFLEHSFQLIANHNYIGDLWSPAFFYPYKEVLAFSDNLFASAPIYWLFRSFASSSLAFQLWMIAVSMLNFASFAFLMKQFRVSHLLSGLGAFFFAFSIPRIAKLGHQQLLPQFFTPIAFFAAWKFILNPSKKWLILLLLFTYLQVLAGIYLGWFLLFSLPIFFVIAYKLNSQVWNKFIDYFKLNKKFIIASILVWIISLVVTLLPYLKASLVFGKRNYSEVDSMLPRISSWFSVPPGSIWSSLLASNYKSLPAVHEHYMFAGFTLVLLSVVCAYILLYRRNILPQTKIWLISTCLLVFCSIFILSLRLPFGFTLWRIIYEIVPGASVIRAVTRIWTIAYFYLLIAVILCIDSVFRVDFLSKQRRLVIVSLLCIVGISEQILFNQPSFDKAFVNKDVVETRELIKRDCNVAYISINEKEYYLNQLSAMWAGLEANVPVINGISGQVPPNYGDNRKSMNTAQIINWLDPAGKITNSKLCIVAQQSLEQQDSLIDNYATTIKKSNSNNLVLHIIQLPLPKIFAQEIKFFDLPKQVPAKSTIKLPILVKNTSNFLWSRKGSNPTKFSYRWLITDRRLARFDEEGDRTSLPYDLLPEESVALNAKIKTPANPGQYKLILTMVQEYVAWFHDQNTKYLEIPVEVVSR
ncbi:MAG: hypothetical protein IGS49_02080 [Chlorogloeopsis fritschii C42_A2020_084]|uniref:hypothetical protein n=1 Tax=Chlorogloeopsis fritschii TaxID=1124 RepID=UPI001A063D8D|nr:hypothetical protein [Chlorogloeopsis fritschii]MBF2004283.1 hypothetical protein [Chlorogloeopsis fritschii C42_A2020_084]